MFERLQTKWRVTGAQLFLVLCVFALGGSATGWLGKIVMNFLSIKPAWLWTLIYVIVVTLIWPVTVLVVSIPFGQFSFFKKYLARIAKRIKISGTDKELQIQNSKLTVQNADIPMKKPVQIAIFASGTGSNANKIIEHFNNSQKRKPAAVKLVVCNKPGAGVLDIARQHGVPTLILEKEQFFKGNAYVDELKNAGIQFIVLAGFLWKIPQGLIDHYRNKIVNIHPALLPKFGGKGMFGRKVHETVILAGETESGITIHYVDEHYDNGDIIFQEKVTVANDETPETLANKIHRLEHAHYPMIIEHLILQPNGR